MTAPGDPYSEAESEADREDREEEDRILSLYPPGSDVVIQRDAAGNVLCHHLVEPE